MSAALIQAAHLIDTATIERLTRAPDAAGGWTEAWTVIGTAPCNVQFLRVTDVERTLDQGEVRGDGAIIRMPPDADVQADDRITVGGVRYRATSARVKTRAWTTVVIARRWGDE